MRRGLRRRKGRVGASDVGERGGKSRGRCRDSRVRDRVGLKRGTASFKTRSRLRSLRPRSLTTSTRRPSSSSSSRVMAELLRRVKPGRGSTRRSRSLSSSASPRATEPIDDGRFAPRTLRPWRGSPLAVPSGPPQASSTTRWTMKRVSSFGDKLADFVFGSCLQLIE